MNAKTKRRGPCAVCNQDMILVWHHCHTKDLVREAYLEGLSMLGVPNERIADVLRDTCIWGDDPATAAARRFERVRICYECNNVDMADPLSIPGRCFSLSPEELREVRRAAGSFEYKGEAFLDALRAVRGRAAQSFLKQQMLAKAAGHSIALRYWGEGRVQRVIENIEKRAADGIEELRG